MEKKVVPSKVVRKVKLIPKQFKEARESIDKPPLSQAETRVVVDLKTPPLQPTRHDYNPDSGPSDPESSGSELPAPDSDPEPDPANVEECRLGVFVIETTEVNRDPALNYDCT